MSKISVHQRKARDFIQREDWGNAVVELERMLGADTQNPTLHNQIGDVYLRKDEVGRACEHFERAIDLYAVVGLHNNAVALCKKIQRLRPGRVEVRYRLAKLRLEQGFRSDAAASFREYLEHAAQSGEGPEQLEQRCREIVELMPEEAPIGLVLEKLEVAQRFVAAFEIVRTLAQRAADAGDDAAAKRYGEKMRSLRVLVERSGGRDLLAEPHSQRNDAAAAPAPLVVGEPASRSVFEPRILDLGAPTRSPRPTDVVTPLLIEPRPVPPVEAPVAPEPSRPPAVAAVADVSDIELPFIGGGFEPFGPAAADLDAMAPEPELEAPAQEAAALFDPLAFDADDAPTDDDAGSAHFADLAAALGGGSDDGLDALEAPAAPASAAASAGCDVAALEPTPTRAAPAPLYVEPAPTQPTPAQYEPDGAPDMDRQEYAVSELAPPQHVAPASTTTRWVDELRRSPVWIPSGDMLSGPDPERPDRGLSMELESVIDSFREQMTRALDGDGQARYDLGVAYYDMGLYNEALAEFEAAAASGGLEVQSYEMLAQCLLQTGRHAEVVELLLPVIAADGHTYRGALGLHYCLGLAYEGIGDFDQARRCYEEVALVDVDFKDVQSRLQGT